MKELTIHINQDDLPILKDNGYKLCLAVSTADEAYDLIWQTTPYYMANNQVEIDEKFQLFCSNRFEPGRKVQITTQTVDICRGQKCTLDSNGILGGAVSVEKSSALALDNEYRPIYVGYCMGGVNFEGQAIMKPAYVTSTASVPGTCEIIPLLEIMIWFEQNVEEGQMMTPKSKGLKSSRSREMTVDFSIQDTASVRYQNGSWVKE